MKLYYWWGSWPQMYKWQEFRWSQRVSLIDSVWFVGVLCSFTMTVTEPAWLLFQNLQWEAERSRGKRVKARNWSLQIMGQQKDFCEKQWIDQSILRDYGKSLPAEKRTQSRKVMSWLKLSQEVGCSCKDVVNWGRLLIIFFCSLL